MAGWTSNVIDSMVECKTMGLRFEEAWQLALKRFPPMRRDLGPREPSLLEQDEPSVVDFVREACADAWYGRRPQLRFLQPLLDRDQLLLDDDSRSAHVAGARGEVARVVY